MKAKGGVLKLRQCACETHALASVVGRHRLSLLSTLLTPSPSPPPRFFDRRAFDSLGRCSTTRRQSRAARRTLTSARGGTGSRHGQ
eukprot:1022625-Pleurochrysis_carterae.AAC.1